MALKDIKGKIQATKRMNTVTRAMEAVSAVKMRKTQESAFTGRPYARAALSILARLSGTSDMSKHALATEREVKKTALVIITSDKGLAGALNSGVIKAAWAAVGELPKDTVRVYAYGKKGEEFFRRRGYEIVEAFENKRDDISLSAMEDMSSKLTQDFLSGAHDRVIAAYSNLKSTFEQKPTVRQILPLSLDAITKIVRDINPVKGKWSDREDAPAPASYTVEPTNDDVLTILVPRLVAVSLYFMMVESKASEHSARMVAMKNASDKSKEVARDLTRIYNKVRQAAITREVSEIVGGREALSS